VVFLVVGCFTYFSVLGLAYLIKSQVRSDNSKIVQAIAKDFGLGEKAGHTI
jgi:hypothetical protein